MTMKNMFDSLERGPTVPGHAEDKKSYHRYWELGGIINEKDYESALTRAENTTALNKTQIMQAEGIAKLAGIELRNTEGAVDQRVILYGILRSDAKPEGVKDHHAQMDDQRIFAESLRMLGDIDSLNKLIKAYPNISFKYREEEGGEKEYKKAA